MERLNLEYYYGLESEEFKFIKFPRLLIKDKRYKELSSDAKILYGLMLDRMGLSQKNNWYDKQGRAYIYYKLDQIQEDLGCGREKTVKVMNELESVGLIERRRLGQGNPSAIYVKKFTTLTDQNRQENDGNAGGERDSQKFENRTSKSSETELQEIRKSNSKKFGKQTSKSSENELPEVRKANCNNTEDSYTEENKSYQSFTAGEAESVQSGERAKPDVNDLNDPLVLQRVYTDLVRNNVDYPSLIQEYPDDVERIDEMIRVMVNVICFGKKEYNINRCKIPAKVIAAQFCKLDREHMIYALSSMKKATTKITNPEAYMVATLYTSRNTSINDTLQQFNHDTRGYAWDTAPQEEKMDGFDWDSLACNL